MSSPNTQQAKLSFAKKLGRKVKAERTKRGITQEELAERAGYYRTYVGRIENGAMATSVHTVWRLAKAMKISLSDLLWGL